MNWKLFSLKRRRRYLDWASAAPVHQDAKKAFKRSLRTFGNPSSPHAEGRAAREQLEVARTNIARLAGVKPRAVVFTSGATEANALAILGRAARLRESGVRYEDMHALFLPTMHASVLKAIEELAARGVRTEALPLASGAVDLDAVAACLHPKTILVCVDAVCGETGIRYDTLAVRRLIDKEVNDAATHAALMVDASQLPLVEPIERTRLGADLLTLDAQKIGGVRGVGALIVPKQSLITPIIPGGGQEAGLRSGTEPVALAAAFASALAARARVCSSFRERALQERERLIRAIEAGVEGVVVNQGKRQAPHILNLSLPGLDTDYLVAVLDRDGFAVSTKSACEADSLEGSRAVAALTGDQARAASTLRISWGPETPSSAIRAFPRAFTDAVRFLRAG